VDVVQRHWPRPEPRESGYHVPPDEVDALARRVLDAMLTRPFRISRLPLDDEYSQLLARVRHWVQRGQSVRITLGYAP